MDKIQASTTRDVILRNAPNIATGMFGFDARAIASILTGIAWNESRFNPRAHAPNPSTAKGLLQINNITKKEAENALDYVHATDEQMLDADYNAEIGVYVFCHRLKQCGGNVKSAVAAYNQGNCSLKARTRAAVYVSRWQQAMYELQMHGLLDEQSGVTAAGSFY